MNNKIYKKLFGGFGFVIIVSLLTLFVMSQTYIHLRPSVVVSSAAESPCSVSMQV